MNAYLPELPGQPQQKLQYDWKREHIDGKPCWTCELEEYDLYVDPEPNELFSFSVADKDGELIRSEFDYEEEAEALLAAEEKWESFLKPIPRLSSKGQSFKWLPVEKGAGSECRIGARNSVLLQTLRDEDSGMWSFWAYCQNVLLVEELEACKTSVVAQTRLESWYKSNATGLLQIHYLHS